MRLQPGGSVGGGRLPGWLDTDLGSQQNVCKLTIKNSICSAGTAGPMSCSVCSWMIWLHCTYFVLSYSISFMHQFMIAFFMPQWTANSFLFHIGECCDEEHDSAWPRNRHIIPLFLVWQHNARITWRLAFYLEALQICRLVSFSRSIIQNSCWTLLIW